MNVLKNKKRALLCLALVMCVIASLFAFTGVGASAADTAESEESNLTFAADRYYVMNEPIASSGGFTFEAEFSIPYEYKTTRPGVIIGNYDDNDAEYRASGEKQSKALSFELVYESSKIKARVYTRHAGQVKFDYDLAQDLFEADGVTPKYVKISVVADPSKTSDNLILYVNGVEKKTATNTNTDFIEGCFEELENMWIGADPRKDISISYFKGSIKNVAVYNDIRTAEEIAADAEEFVPDASDAALACAYDLTRLEMNGGYLNDLSKNGNNAVNPNWTADGIGKTFTSSDAYYLTKDLEVMPQTFEAVVYAPTSLSRPGVIFGNYHGSEAALNFELHSEGKATIHLDPDYSTGAYAAKIADVRSNYGFVHIVIVRTRDTANGATYSLYVDGELAATAQTNYPSKDKVDLDMAEVQSKYNLQLGGDSRDGNAKYFQGRIKNLALYSEALSAEEVFTSYKNGVGSVRDKDSGLLLNYDMTTEESADYVRDLSGNEHHVTQNGVPFDSFFRGRGFDSEDELYLEKPLSAQPQTYEAWVLAPSAVSRTGVILGNYGSGSTSLVNFELYTNGAPSVYIKNENGDLMDTKFDYSINNDEWSHVVITHEYLSSGGARFTCYVNGEEVDSFDTDLSYKIADASTIGSLSLGRDSRSGNTQYFKGRIKNAALYSDVLTPEEIKTSYESGINTDDESLILCYNLQGTDGAEKIEDASGNGYDAHSLFFENESPLVLGEDYAYSLAVVGDTQKLVYYDAYNGTSYASYIYDWIAANKTSKNIQFVMGLGDITDKNGKDNTSSDGINQTDIEWNNIVNELAKLENIGLSYSLIQGNHDSVAKLDEFFADNTNFTESDIGYYSGTSLGNYYMRFNACDNDGNVKDQYMVVVLQYGPTDAILNWAGGVIAANPDHKVIITTHAYMFRDGTTLDINDVVPPRKATDTNGKNNGDQIWTKLVSQYPNVVFALGGHDPYANIAWRQDLGVNGNTVTQMLIDFQSMDTAYSYETGMVAMFYFSADGKQVKVEYISTYNSIEQDKDVIYNAALNQFDFDIPDPVVQNDVEVTINGIGGYIVPGMYSNEITYPFVAFESDKTFIGAYGDLGGATAAAKSCGTTGDYVILMRRDAEQNTESKGLASVTGSITIDLGGYTLYKTAVGYIFDMYVDDNSSAVLNEKGVDVRGTFAIKNGHIVSYCESYPLACVNYGEALAHDYSISFEFSGVKFTDMNAGSHILDTWENGYNGTSACVYADVLFDNCTFDYKSSAEGTEMIHLIGGNKGYDRTIWNVTVRGGQILSESAVTLGDFVQTDSDINGRADTVTFAAGGDGKYIVQVLPESAVAPSVLDMWSVDTKDMFFVGAKTENGYTTYELIDGDIEDYGDVTKYGFIPEKYTDTNDYPIIVFKNGVIVGGYKLFANGTNNGGALAAAKSLTDGNEDGEIGSTVQILFRANAEATGVFTNFGQILGNIVVDLNGYILTQSYDDKSLFFTQAKYWMGMNDANFNVFNGEIVIKTCLLTFNAYGETYQTGDGTDAYKTFNMNFDNVKFSYAEGADSAEFLGVFEDSSGVYGKSVGYNVSFNNCVFDFTNAEKMNLVMNANDTVTASVDGALATNCIVKVTVNGCEIITTNPSLQLYDEHATNGSSVVFAKNEKGAYTKMTVNGNGTYPVAAANGGELVFVKVSVTEDTITYALAPKSLAFYVPQMSITLANSFIMNVYVPANCTEEFTFNGVTYNDDNSFGGNVVTIDGEDYYLVTAPLGSSEAARELKLVAKVNVNESTAIATFTFSIPKYASKLLNDDGATEVEKQLVKDVLAYIQSAYNYFAGHNTAEEIARVNALVNELLLIGGEYSGEPALDGTYSHNTALVKEVTLVLDAKPTIRFYVTNQNVEFYDEDGNKLKVKNETDGYVELDVYAYALSGEITYKLGEESGVYHISDYVYKTVADTDAENYDNLVNLVYCFVKYTESAADYRASVTGGNN